MHYSAAWTTDSIFRCLWKRYPLSFFFKSRNSQKSTGARSGCTVGEGRWPQILLPKIEWWQWKCAALRYCDAVASCHKDVVVSIQYGTGDYETHLGTSHRWQWSSVLQNSGTACPRYRKTLWAPLLLEDAVVWLLFSTLGPAISRQWIPVIAGARNGAPRFCTLSQYSSSNHCRYPSFATTPHIPRPAFACVPWWDNAALMCSKLCIRRTPSQFGRLLWVKRSDWSTIDELKCAGYPQSRLRWYLHWSLFPLFLVAHCAGWVPPSFALHETFYAIDKWLPYSDIDHNTHLTSPFSYQPHIILNTHSTG